MAGTGVGLGYWKNKQKTSAAFSQNPFIAKGVPVAYAKMFKTGDTGFLRPDGSLVCLGRTDELLKVNGFRIEPSEIEKNILAAPEIVEAVVVAIGHDDKKCLAAYLVAKQIVNTEALKKRISKELPYYMVPKFLVQIEHIPLTINGKLDKKQLPVPELETYTDIVAPDNAVQARLLEIWSEALDLNKIGISIDHNFFYLGGHSLTAIKVLNKVNHEFSVNFSLGAFFNRSTIRLIAEDIESIQWLNSNEPELADEVTFQI